MIKMFSHGSSFLVKLRNFLTILVYMIISVGRTDRDLGVLILTYDNQKCLFLVIDCFCHVPFIV